MFKGLVKMYDESLYINTDTKEGYGRVLERIDPLLCKMASKTYIPSSNFEDIKQDLSIMAIEGIDSYNPDKKVKLSTFLHIHLRNKLISKIKSANKLSNDASFFKTSDAFLCSCGEEIRVDKSNSPVTCPGCGKQHASTYKRSREEINFGAIPKRSPSDGEEYAEFETTLSSEDGLYPTPRSDYADVELSLLIDKLSDSLDPTTSSILKMVCLEGYSIKDAAAKFGLTGWAASMRLKKLSRYSILRDLMV